MIYSCLSYPGAKRKVIDDIMRLVPDGVEDWREPFLGGGSVTIGFLQSEKSKDCKKFVVGDLYKELWSFWVGIQKDPKKCQEYVLEMFNEHCPNHDKLVQMSEDTEGFDEMFELAVEEEGRKFWDWTQTVDTETMSIYERAARFYIVNQISFSSMSDSGSLSRDRFQAFNTSKSKRFFEVSDLIQRLEILNAPFQTTMADVNSKSFVFLDPPYINQEGSGLYGKKGSTHKGFPHLELADLCKSLECPWLMTIDDSVKSRRLYKGCNISKLYIPYTMAMRGAEDALAGEELFISNYNTEEETNFDNLDDII